MKTPHQNSKSSVQERLGVSIVVPIRNEASGIKKCLDSILNQKYKSDLTELIVVDDFSTDQTPRILSEYSGQITFLSLKDHLAEERANFANKKQALTLAVSKAKFPLILCADGDCYYGPLWIQSMVQYYEKYAKRFISGPVDYESSEGLWNKFLLMDLVAMIGLTAGSIGQKRPVMASGANMLFEKSVFEEVNGFEGNDHIASGDDVFLMQKVFNLDPKSIGFTKNQQAFAITQGPSSLKGFIHQRIRWTSKSGQMIDPQVKGVLVLNYLFYLVCFLNLFILPWFNPIYLFIGVVLLGLKILIDTLFFKNILAFYKKSHLLAWLLPIELLHIVYVTFMGVLAIFGQYSWKGRNIQR